MYAAENTDSLTLHCNRSFQNYSNSSLRLFSNYIFRLFRKARLVEISRTKNSLKIKKILKFKNDQKYLDLLDAE